MSKIISFKFSAEFFLFLCVFLLLCFMCSSAFALESFVLGETEPSLLLWVKLNISPILAVLFGISELMAQTKRFKGNGIFDTLFKCAKFLVEEVEKEKTNREGSFK